MKISRQQIPRELIYIIRTLRRHNHQAFLVGGAARDLLLRRTPKDWDVVTEATPVMVQKLFSHTVPTGLKFGTVTVLVKRLPVQVTTFRKEGKYVDRRRPAHVAFVKDLISDLARRDFTINAIALDIENERLIDPFEGIKDLKSGRLRSVGSARKRFSEDTLRAIRAGRFIAELGVRPTKELNQAAAFVAKQILKLARERIQIELEKLLLSKHPSWGLLWMEKVGILGQILPELIACKGVRQGGWHQYDVFHHTLRAVEQTPPDLCLRLALLFHDIAKPITRTRDRFGYHFYGHDRLGAEMSRKILKRLRFPIQLIEDVAALIRHHLFEADPISGSDTAVRRLIRRVGDERFFKLLMFRKADVLACGPQSRVSPSLAAIRRRGQRIFRAQEALTVRDLAVNGNDIMRWLKIPPGPLVGQILRILLEQVISDPKKNTYKRLRELVLGSS